MIGKLLGNLKIIAKLGEGGMGVVYLAEHITLGNRFAVKSLAVKLTEDSDFRERFYNEARNQALLDHQNIVQVTDFHEQDGQYFLVMQFVSGQALDEKIKQQGKLDEATALHIQKDILSGLSFAHSKGVIHRDIKPSNVIVDESGRARITDFGIAILISNKRLTAVGGMVGSFWFMSPEQIINPSHIDHRSDVYSAGIVLYEMLTGTVPFEGESDFTIQNKQVNDPVPDPTLKNPEITPELKKIILKALEKIPDKRYSGCGEFLACIEAYESKVYRNAPLQVSLTKKIKGLLRYFGKNEKPNIQNQFKHTTALPESGGDSNMSDHTIIRPFKASPELISSAVEYQKNESHSNTSFFQRPGTQEPSKTPDVALTITRSASKTFIGKKISLSHFPYRIGRDANEDYVISDDYAVSREHVIFDYKEGTFTIRDARSSNGTYINGKLMQSDQPEILLFGDIISLSERTVLTFISETVSELPDLTAKVMKTPNNLYDLTALLHSSEKAAIYRAYDRKFDRNVAVKIFTPQLSFIKAYMEQFKRESEIAGRLRHSNICRVLDFGQAFIELDNSQIEQMPYLCMELMDGGNLTEYIKKHSISIDQVTNWIIKLGEALEYVHKQGIIHGGIKTSSIVFDQQQNPYITDFAIASQVHDKRNVYMMGAPAYLAPEQWDGKDISPATDQYSLAVLIYVLVTGVLPFEGQENPEVRRRNYLRGVMLAHEEAARNGKMDIPTEVSKVLEQALSIKPEERFSSVYEFAKEFEIAALNNRLNQKSVSLPLVFISYNRESSAGWANFLAREFKETHGISPFLDTQRLDTAVRFPARLKRAIEECNVFICLLAETTLDSKWVREEIRLAYENNKPMLPVFLDSFSKSSQNVPKETHIEELLKYQGIPLYDLNNPDISHTIAVLAQMVKRTIDEI